METTIFLGYVSFREFMWYGNTQHPFPLLHQILYTTWDASDFSNCGIKSVHQLHCIDALKASLDMKTRSNSTKKTKNKLILDDSYSYQPIRS